MDEDNSFDPYRDVYECAREEMWNIMKDNCGRYLFPCINCTYDTCPLLKEK